MFQRAVYPHSQRMQNKEKQPLRWVQSWIAEQYFVFLWKCSFPLEGRLQETEAYVSDQKVGGQEIPNPYKASHGI